MSDAELEVAAELLEGKAGRGELAERLLRLAGWSRETVYAEWDRIRRDESTPADPAKCRRCARPFTSKVKPSASRPGYCRHCRGLMP